MNIGIPAFFINSVKVGGFNYIDMAAMIISAILLYFLTRKEHKLNRISGIVMLIMFIVYYTYVIVGGLA